MAAFRFFDGNLGFYGYDQLTDYTIVSQGATSTVMDWKTSLGPLDATHFAAHVTLTYSGFTSYVIEDGPGAGQTKVTGGTMTGITYTNAGGATLLDITGLAISLPVFMSLLDRGDAFGSWQMINHAGATNIVGSQNASGPGHAGTGDVIDTTFGADVVSALGGDDFVQDRGGADTYNGGLGIDTLSYEGWNFTPWAATQGLAIDQLLGTIVGPDGQTDKISGFEDIVGTFLADSMKGNSGANQFEGGDGVDVIDGRGGRDVVSYARDADWGGTDGIRVNLANNTVRDGFGQVDKVRNVEVIIGTATRDVFFDSAADNSFDGGAGNDLLHFSLGNDVGHGGLGADTFFFDGTFSDDSIDDFHLAEGDKIRITAATAFSQLQLIDITTDSGIGVVVLFAGNSVTIDGVAAADLHAADFGF